MFSFTTHSSNPFPTLIPSSSSSSYPPFPFYNIDPENGFASSNTNSHDPLAVLPFMPSSQAPPTPQTVTNLYSVADYSTAMFQKDDGSNSVYSKFVTKIAAAGKKDRHSKIHTSQGLRDRRVRLSSKIARKFFDLQEMLECDKPSNTLEWLFTKSENAIKELATSKHSCNGVDSNDKSLVCQCAAKERKLKWEEKEAKKESREKARARARERTASSKLPPVPLQLQILQYQLMPPIDQPHHQAFATYPHHGLLGSEEPPIVLKRNLKPSNLLSSQEHQNLVIPREASFNNINDYHSLSNSPQNWDTNNGQLNLSTELQILGNSWKECTNQCPH